MTQDLNQLHSRVSNIDDRMTALLRGIVYLISLRWVFSNTNSSRNVSGSEVVNEVMSNERPFSFESARPTQNLVETTTTTTQVATQIVVETTEISTQTDDTDSDQIYSLIRPHINAYGINRVLWRLRSVLPIINDSMLWGNDEVEAPNTDSADTPDAIRGTSPLESTEHSPVTDLSTDSPVTYLSTPEVAVTDSSDHSPVAVINSSESSPVAVTDSSDRLESTVRYSESSTIHSEITPRRLDDGFRVIDNPTFRPTDSTTSSPYSATEPPAPIEPENNPYQFHRYRFFRVERIFPSICEFLHRFGF